MDGLETELKTSGNRVRDPDLNAYVRDIVCRLVPDHCGDIRLYIVRMPYFNASIAPNGAMQVWTGLLLRAENEAQLSYVLGHEVGHFLRHHTLSRWRDARTKTDAAAFFQVMASAAGVGYAGYVAQLAALGSVFAFSREQEREADEIGFNLLIEAGYDGREAAKTWENLLKEREVSDDPESSMFFSTHPATEERVATLRSLTTQRVAAPQPEQGQGRYMSAIAASRDDWLRDELRKREFAETVVLLDQLSKQAPRLGETHFFRGELLRLRDDEGDEQQALEAYRAALSFADAPAETHRALGTILMKRGQMDEANNAFRAYLEARPEADDRAMIEHYLEL